MPGDVHGPKYSREGNGDNVWDRYWGKYLHWKDQEVQEIPNPQKSYGSSMAAKGEHSSVLVSWGAGNQGVLAGCFNSPLRIPALHQEAENEKPECGRDPKYIL